MLCNKKLAVSFAVLLLLGNTAVFSQEGNSEKPIAAVLDLTAEEISESEARAITNLLIAALHGTDLVQIIDRNQREEILSEISFSLSGCADDSCALEIGKMLAADLLITGSLARVGSRVSIELKALSVEEGSILETTFKLFDSVDEVVDNIDTIGATLMQNVTGRKAAQREILEYEDLVTLTVLSTTENASVVINGTPVGRIRNGRLTKALNRNIDVLIEITSENFYPVKKEIYLDQDFSIQLDLEAHYPVKSALRLSSGGGSMGSFYGRYYLMPAFWFTDMGLGFTIQNTIDFYLKTMLQFKTGVYFANENNFIRPWGGFMLMTPFLDLFTLPDETTIVRFFGTEDPNDYNMVKDRNSKLADLDYGIVFGLDFCITENLYLGFEADLYVNKAYQMADGYPYNILDYLLAPATELINVTGFDPAVQFGFSAVIHQPAPYKSNHPDSMDTKGKKIIWRKQEYAPGLFTGYENFFSTLLTEPDISQDVRDRIKEYRDFKGAIEIAMGVSALTAMVSGGWMLADALASDFTEPPNPTLVGVELSGIVAGLLSNIVWGISYPPRKVVNSYNQNLGGAE